jgi:hypothetical protein
MKFLKVRSSHKKSNSKKKQSQFSIIFYPSLPVLQCSKRRDFVSLIEIYIGIASRKIFNIKVVLDYILLYSFNYCPIIFVYDFF